MPVEWALSMVVPIFKRKGDIRYSSCYRAMCLLEHEMKVVETVLVNSLCRIVTVNEMQFGFMPVRGIIDAMFFLRRLIELHHANWKKLYVFCGPRESF